ncbi:hypothetical protein PED39_01910 [Methanomassiliicoccales archaeon LGM-RCC1]|nr:hypothetical protein PED39_01910 [Methanomassiliicoccales archaeon LGM-RCC1]
MDTDILIRNTIKIRDDFIHILDGANISYQPIEKNLGGFVLITACGDQQIIQVDQKELDSLKMRWNTWVDHVKPYYGRNDCVYKAIVQIDQNIKCGWRVHDKDLNKFKEKVRFALDGMLEILEEEQQYKINEHVNLIDSEHITINITTKILTLNITDLQAIYQKVRQIAIDSDISEEDRQEIINITKEGENHPDDISVLKRLGNRIHNRLEQYSPELGIVSLFLQTFGPALGI